MNSFLWIVVLSGGQVPYEHSLAALTTLQSEIIQAHAKVETIRLDYSIPKKKPKSAAHAKTTPHTKVLQPTITSSHVTMPEDVTGWLKLLKINHKEFP